ncbi:MAG: hypothetical protein HUK25_03350 [Treponema sp.]|nr:hypothetical protein [Treponema sp.]
MKCFKHLAKGKKILLLSALVALAGTTAFAQSSVESKATDGVFLSDADYFMDTIKWGKLNFDKAYIEAQMNGNYLNAGTALKLGGLYTSFYYTGNLLNWDFGNGTTAASTITEVTAHDLFESSVSKELNKNDNATWGSNNTFRAMIGIANMGILLGYNGNGTSESGTFNDLNGTVANTTTHEYSHGASTASYTDTIYGNGTYNFNKNYIPQVGFGIDLGNIRPYAALPVQFQSNARSFNRTTKTVTNGVVTQELYEAQERKGTSGSESFVLINPTIGTEIDLKYGYINVSYTPNIYFFDPNPYSTTITSVRTTYTPLSNNKTVVTSITKDNFGSKTKFDNNLYFSYVFEKPIAEKFTLGAKATLNADLNFDTTVSVRNLSSGGAYTESSTATYTNKDGSANKTTTIKYVEGGETTTNKVAFNAYPQISGSVKYDVSDKVSLLFGAKLKVNAKYDTSTTTVNPNSTEVTKVTNTATEENSVTKTVNTTSPVNESNTNNFDCNVDYTAGFGVVFTPVKAFDFGIYLDLKSLATITPFANCSVQAEVRF